MPKRKISKENKHRFSILRELHCMTCGNHQTEVHHVIGHGLGMKAPDEMTFQLCHNCHMELHHHGHRTWEAKHGKTQLEFVEIATNMIDIYERIS